MNAVTHLFRGRDYAAPSQSQVNEALDELAEYLSRDLYSIPEIARRMHVSGGTVCALLTMLCDRYGETVQ